MRFVLAPSRFLLLCCCLLIAPLQAQIITSPNDDRDYKVITLDNQLEVLLVSDPSAKNSAATIAVPVGSMHNPDTQLGLAHYLEHMLFLGSERYPEINDYSKFMRLNGGYTNAYTAQDRTVYGFEVNDKVYGEALDRLGDVMRAPLLDEHYADKERSTVNAEQQTYKGHDGRKLYALERFTLNPDHPMSRFSTGDLETLKDKPGSKLQDELVTFFNAYYSANLMKAVLYGPRDLATQEQLAKQYLTQIPNRDAKTPLILAPLVTEKELAIEASLKPSSDIKVLKMSFVMPSFAEFYPYKPGIFVSRILGSDRSGTLSDYLQQAGLIESLMAGFDARYSPTDSSMTVQFQLTDAGVRQQDKIIAATFAYIELIKQTGVTQAQYQALEQSLTNSFAYLPKKGGFSYSMVLVANMLSLPTEEVISAPFRLDGFNPELVKQTLSYLTPERVRLFVAHPEVVGDKVLYSYGDSYRVAPISASRMKQWQQQLPVLTKAMHLPEGNRWLPEDKSIVKPEHQQQAVELVKQPGLSLWFKQSAFFQEPKGSIAVELNNDLLDRSAQQRITGALLNEILAKQLVGLSYEAGEANLSLSVTTSNGLLFTTGGFSDKQSELMLTLLDTVKSAKFSQQALDLAKVEIRRLIENKLKDQSMSLAFAEFRNLVRLPSWSDQTLLTELDKVSLAQLTQLRDDMFSQSALRMLVTGNFTSKQAIALQQQVVKRAPIAKPDFYKLTRITPQPNQRLAWSLASEMGDAALAYIFISTKAGEAGQVQAELLNKIAYSDFYDLIRTQDQLSYSPFTLSFPVDDYAAFGLFTQSPEQGPKHLKQRYDFFIQQFAKKLADYDQGEFAKIKQAHIANYQKKPSNLGEEFGYIQGQWDDQKADLNTKAKRIALIEQTTLKQVQDLYQSMVLGKDNEQFLIQVRGSQFVESPLAELTGSTKVTDLDKWQQSRHSQ
ncbi:insulinase family protein [Motilimonas eburnea]|uniref:insulinase family protein n=1 Tax=Motilimonas eburnea TaxID=1737488 RepID=UPI001E4E74A6|nr:insulinase family protein [Motilimonas eburnea]MCE2572416.1 insulinase family protein [Motilimonas eburnea]